MNRTGVSTLLVGCALSAAACKVQLGSGPDGEVADAPPGGTDAPSDAGIDAPAPLGPWGTPVIVPGASSTGASEDDVTLSANALELVFAINGQNGKDLYYMSRASTAAAWSGPTALAFNSGTASDETPRFSADGLTLYFASTRNTGNLDIFRVTRPAIGAAWSMTPQLVPGVSTGQDDKWFVPCSTGDTYLAIRNEDVAEGTLGSPPTVVAALSSTSGETGTFLSPDCLTVHFASTRSGPNRLYRSTRTAIGAPWSAPVLVDDFVASIGGNQEDPWLSPDLRIFAFASNARGTKDVYISTR